MWSDKKKLLELLQKTIYSNRIYLNMITDRVTMVVILVIIHNFDIRFQKNFESSEPAKVEFKISENIPP